MKNPDFAGSLDMEWSVGSLDMEWPINES